MRVGAGVLTENDRRNLRFGKGGRQAPLTREARALHQRSEDEPFGHWALSSELEDLTASPWAWAFVPLGALLLIAAFQLVNAVARACGRWATTSLR